MPAKLALNFELTTNRLLIRRFYESDAIDYNCAIHDAKESLQRWFSWATPLPTLEESLTFIASATLLMEKGSAYHFPIFLKGKDKFIGSISLTLENDAPSWQMGYWLAPKFEGQGYASEAVIAMTKLAFEYLEAQRVFFRIDERNVRSQKIPPKFAFRHEGTLLNCEKLPNGHLQNMQIHAHTPSSWQEFCNS